MFTLQIEHPITEFATWRAAFDSFGAARDRAGVMAARVHRPVDDPRYVLVELDFGTEEGASAFREFLRTRVWATPDSSPALAGTPQTRILRSEPVS